jgi:hypothetical protein
MIELVAIFAVVFFIRDRLNERAWTSAELKQLEDQQLRLEVELKYPREYIEGEIIKIDTPMKSSPDWEQWKELIIESFYQLRKEELKK